MQVTFTLRDLIVHATDVISKAFLLKSFHP